MPTYRAHFLNAAMDILKREDLESPTDEEAVKIASPWAYDHVFVDLIDRSASRAGFADDTSLVRQLVPFTCRKRPEQGK